MKTSWLVPVCVGAALLFSACGDNATATTSSVLNLGVSLRCVAGTSLCAIGTAYVAYACIAWLRSAARSRRRPTSA